MTRTHFNGVCEYPLKEHTQLVQFAHKANQNSIEIEITADIFFGFVVRIWFLGEKMFFFGR